MKINQDKTTSVIVNNTSIASAPAGGVVKNKTTVSSRGPGILNRQPKNPEAHDQFAMGSDGTREMEARQEKIKKMEEKIWTKEEIKDLDSPDNFDQLRESLENIREIKANLKKLKQKKNSAINRLDGNKPGGDKPDGISPVKPGEHFTSLPVANKPSSADQGVTISPDTCQNSSGYSDTNCQEKPITGDLKPDNPSGQDEAQQLPADDPDGGQDKTDQEIKPEVDQDPRKSAAQSHLEQVKSKADHAKIEQKEQTEKVTREIRDIEEKIAQTKTRVETLEQDLENLTQENQDNPDFDPEPLKLMIEQKKAQLERMEQERFRKRLKLEEVTGAPVDPEALQQGNIDSAINQAVLEREQAESNQQAARMVIETNLDFLKSNSGDISKAELVSGISDGDGLEAVRDMQGLQDLIREKKT